MKSSHCYDERQDIPFIGSKTEYHQNWVSWLQALGVLGKQKALLWFLECFSWAQKHPVRMTRRWCTLAEDPTQQPSKARLCPIYLLACSGPSHHHLFPKAALTLPVMVTNNRLLLKTSNFPFPSLSPWVTCHKTVHSNLESLTVFLIYPPILWS